MHTNRRSWLKSSALMVAALGLKPHLFAADEKLPPHASGMILLNSNENAYGPSPLARKAILDHYLQSNRYPDDYIPLLKKKIAGHWSVNPENILLGAGSSEIIGLSCLIASQQKGHIITAEPAYKVWNNQAASFGLSFNRTTLDDEKKYDLSKMSAAITSDTRMIYICNPNNPTGTFVDTEKLKDFAAAASGKVPVFIDEAYTEFAGLPSLAVWAVTNPNIIVAKTFSKVYGLAGARVGYAIAHPDTIKKLGSLQPWPDASVSMVSANAALAALDDQEFVNDCKQKAAQAREKCYGSFKKLGLEYIPSSTNFILFNIDKIKGDLAEQMQARNIYIQHREHFGGRWCRVSMGTLEEMDQFVNALAEIKG